MSVWKALFLKMAFRNLWRRKARTTVVVAMIAVGLAILLFLSGLYDGWVCQMVNDTLYSDTCQVTIYGKGYRLSEMLKDSIKNPEKVEQVLSTHPNIKGFYARFKNEGMINSARYSQGVKIIGIDPLRESGLSNLQRSIKKGVFEFKKDKKEIIIGASLADELKVKLKSKVVIMGQAKDKSIASAAFRVVGIVRTNNPAIDKYAVFISLPEAQNMFQMGNMVSQYSIVIKAQEKLDLTKQAVAQELGEMYEVFTWKELFKGMEWMQNMMGSYNNIMYSIIFVIVAIGIFNIILISVLERVREFGIMMAMGTQFLQIARIIVWESICIGLLGLLIGCSGGLVLLVFFKIFGLDLSAFSRSLEFFGMAAVIRPQLSITYFIRSILAVLITSLVASVWPIWILKRLKPVQTIHFL